MGDVSPWRRVDRADTPLAVLGDDMGLGKTIQVIAFLSAVMSWFIPFLASRTGADSYLPATRREERQEA